MTIAIHQPNFFPHEAFFQKMALADLFIIMIHCQWEKNNYQNRFNIGDDWYTMSVNHGLKPIIEKKYTSPFIDWSRIHVKLFQYNSIFKELTGYITGSLWETNFKIIEIVAEKLNIKTKIVFDYPTELRGTERLVHFCKIHGATKYLSGASGKKYMDLKLFADAGIEVIFQESKPSKPILEILHERGVS